MTGKYNLKVSIVLSLLFLCHLQLTSASSKLACLKLEPTACRTKFGNLFEEGFKRLHLAAYKEILNAFVNAYGNLKPQLSNDNVFVEILEQKRNEVKEIIQKLDELENNSSELLKTINKAVPAAIISTDEIEAPEKIKTTFNELLEKEKIDETISKVASKFIGDIFKLWSDLKTELREDDLNEYKEYDEINDILQELAIKAENSNQFLGLAAVRGIIGESFKLPYLSGIEVFF